MKSLMKDAYERFWLEKEIKNKTKFFKSFGKQHQGNTHVDILETLKRTELEIENLKERLKNLDSKNDR